MEMKHYTLGLDFGTESARSLLVDVQTGEVAEAVSLAYPDGVIDSHLPGIATPLPPDFALQNPQDWLTTLEFTVRNALQQANIQPEQLIGIGIDFTASTILPTRADGTPLCQAQRWRGHPDAWPKLWKHHAAQPQADRMIRVAEERRESWLKHYGGKISSEWLPAKALAILEDAPEIYNESAIILEGADWVAWQLTGVLAHNACGAGYKGLWHKREGFPSREYLAALNPLFADLYEKLPGQVLPPGERLGGLNEEWARRLGLLEGTVISVPIIDAHSATLGAGVTRAGILFMIMGTSTCHMLMSEQEVFVRGISGVVEDGIARGLYGYEAGQAAVGDIFGWFVEHCVPSEYMKEAEARNLSIHDLLSEKASASLPGQSGLLALDWWNGNRTPLVDADLSGLFIGCTLTSKPEEMYRALIESTAFGTRWIIETFEIQGVPVNSIVAGGGLVKNNLLMQIYADITGREFTVSASPQVSALGAALLASVAAGSENGGYSNLQRAAACMVPKPVQTFQPNTQNKKTYDLLYNEYLRLGRYFSEDNHIMKTLAGLRKLS